MRLPSLTALRAFEASARHKSFSRASQELFVSRSAISHQIQNLEEQLGVTLFNRASRKIELSEEGQALFIGITKAFGHVEECCTQIASPDSPLRESLGERLSIIVPPGFSVVWFSERLAKFSNEHPEVEFEIISSSDLSDIRSGKVKFAITWTVQPYPDLSEIILYDAVDFPVCSPDLLKRGPPIETPEDILNYPLIHFESQEWWSIWFLDHGVEAASLRGHVTNDIWLNLELARRGLGISLATSVSAAKLLRTGELIRLLKVDWKNQLRVRLLISPSALEDPLVVLFRDWIIKERDRFVDKEPNRSSGTVSRLR